MISKENKLRYDRHIKLQEVGVEGQGKINNSSVLVVGAGGLGCPVLQYLTAAGVGTIGVLDSDVVNLSNLQRQVLYTASDVGRLKTTTAIEFLSKQNPLVNFKEVSKYLNKDNALEIVRDYDIVVDCTDNFPSRYLINDACVLLNKPFVYGALHKFSGQVSVFNFNGGPTYRCLYPNIPNKDEIPNCSETGVLGVVPSLIGSLQATEVLKIILGLGDVLSGKILTYDILQNIQSVISFSKSEVKIDKLGDYNFVCDNPLKDEISSAQLMKWLNNKKEFNLVDIREEYEREDYKLDDTHFIPMNDILSSLDQINKIVPTVIYCESGSKSKSIVYMLKKQGFDNIYSLEGGVQQWKLLEILS